MSFLRPEEQIERISYGAVDFISEVDFLKKIRRSFETQKPLRVKLGADPNRPDIHLGHTVVINKLKVLQDLGHRVQFLIGDFTALIGDPTGKNTTRPILSRKRSIKMLGPTRNRYSRFWIQIRPKLFIIRVGS
jgi:tyrosyl-tRNA synthetase